MQILVTGAAGFIGANLCQRLRREWPDATLVGVDDLSTGDERNLDGCDLTLHRCSILSPEFPAIAERADSIVHLAALPSVARSVEAPLRSHDVNANGTLAVLEAARAARNAHVILASSSSVYGASELLPKSENHAPRPMSPYAASKLAAETYALAYQGCYGLPVLAFRFFNVYGPLQRPGHAYAAAIPAFLDAALNNSAVTVFGDGHQSRDFTFVDTVTEVIIDGIRNRITHPTAVNLAYGSRTSLLEILAELRTLLGRDIEVDHGAPRTGDVPHSQADSTVVRSLFPDIQPTPLGDGLRATADWMRSLSAPSIAPAPRS